MPVSRRELLTRSLAGAVFPALPALRAQSPGKGKLRAGTATVNITPPLGSSLAGGMTNRIATEIHDELHVRAIALDNGQARIALAVVDSCAVPRSVLDRSKELVSNAAGVPAGHLLISATHTHSAPPATHLFQSIPDPKYVDWLAVRIADAIRLAFHRLEPARLGWGVGREERLVFNRRYYMKPGAIPPDPFGRTTDRVQMNPPVGSPDIVKVAGPTDPEVGVIAIESADGGPLALLASYALHYVGGTGANDVTADYFGVWANSIKRIAGLQDSRRFPEFVPILSNACSGNINGVNFLGKPRRYAPYEQMQRYADTLAAECYRVWRNIDFQDSLELGGSIEELDLSTRLPDAEDVAAARKLLASAPQGTQYKERPQIYARETLLLGEEYPRTVKAPVQALRIGSLGIATFPGEAFVELGLEVKAKSPFRPTMLIELANDYRGYLPTVEGHELGGYETWRAKSSYLEVEAAPKMVASALRQLGKLS